jgi:hypothetical protein
MTERPGNEPSITHAEKVELSEERRSVDSFIVAAPQGADGPISPVMSPGPTNQAGSEAEQSSAPGGDD